jgi:hypothetical protein
MSDTIRPLLAAIAGATILVLGLQAQRSQRDIAAIPQLMDITASTGIHFNHLASPDKKYL